MLIFDHYFHRIYNIGRVYFGLEQPRSLRYLEHVIVALAITDTMLNSHNKERLRKQSCPGTTTKSNIAIKQATLRFMQHHSYLSNAQKPFFIVFPQSMEFKEVRYESP